MIRIFLVLVAVLASLGAMAQSGASKEEQDAAFQTLRACLYKNVVQLDDGAIGVETIAKTATAGCYSEVAEFVRVVVGNVRPGDRPLMLQAGQQKSVEVAIGLVLKNRAEKSAANLKGNSSWAFVAKDINGDEIFLNTEDYKVDNEGGVYGKRTSILKIWVLENTPKGDYGVKSYVRQYEIACARQISRTISIVAYPESNGGGGSLGRKDLKEEWAEPVPSSLGKALIKSACSNFGLNARSETKKSL